jgi:hypothetical protein
MKKNTLLRTDGTSEELADGELSLAQMYSAISCGLVEHVQLTRTSELWCDEEGLLKADWQMNAQASALYRSAYPHIPPEDIGIAGNAIYTREA